MTSTSEHPNAQRTRRIIDAATRGDIEAYGQMLSDAVVLHFPGSNRLTGDYRGKEGCSAFLARSLQRPITR